MGRYSQLLDSWARPAGKHPETPFVKSVVTTVTPARSPTPHINTFILLCFDSDLGERNRNYILIALQCLSGRL